MKAAAGLIAVSMFMAFLVGFILLWRHFTIKKKENQA